MPVAYVFCQAKFLPVCISGWYLKIDLPVASKFRKKSTVLQDPELSIKLRILSITVFSIYCGPKWTLRRVNSFKYRSPQRSSWRKLTNCSVNHWVRHHYCHRALTEGVCILTEVTNTERQFLLYLHIHKWMLCLVLHWDHQKLLKSRKRHNKERYRLHKVLDQINQIHE